MSIPKDIYEVEWLKNIGLEVDLVRMDEQSYIQLRRKLHGNFERDS